MMMMRRVVVSMEVSWLNQTEQLPRGTLVRAKAANEYEPYLASQRTPQPHVAQDYNARDVC